MTHSSKRENERARPVSDPVTTPHFEPEDDVKRHRRPARPAGGATRKQGPQGTTRDPNSVTTGTEAEPDDALPRTTARGI